MSRLEHSCWNFLSCLNHPDLGPRFGIPPWYTLFGTLISCIGQVWSFTLRGNTFVELSFPTKRQQITQADFEPGSLQDCICIIGCSLYPYRVVLLTFWISRPSPASSQVPYMFSFCVQVNNNVSLFSLHWNDWWSFQWLNEWFWCYINYNAEVTLWCCCPVTRFDDTLNVK